MSLICGVEAPHDDYGVPRPTCTLGHHVGDHTDGEKSWPNHAAPRFVGLDLSLTSTGVADGETTRCLKVKLPVKATELQRTQRLHTLSVLIDKACRWARLVIIEGPSYGSQATHAHSTGELHGLVKVIMLQRRIPFAVPSPSSLKLYATGKGNASKEAVFKEALKRGAEVNNFDEADAWWLLQMAYAQYGHAHRIVMPAKNTTALEKVQWPQI